MLPLLPLMSPAIGDAMLPDDYAADITMLPPPARLLRRADRPLFAISSYMPLMRYFMLIAAEPPRCLLLPARRRFYARLFAAAAMMPRDAAAAYFI